MNLFQTYSSQYDYPKVEKSDFFETEMWNHCKEVAEKNENNSNLSQRLLFVTAVNPCSFAVKKMPNFSITFLGISLT